MSLGGFAAVSRFWSACHLSSTPLESPLSGATPGHSSLGNPRYSPIQMIDWLAAPGAQC